jgi:hypothetical protein
MLVSLTRSIANNLLVPHEKMHIGNTSITALTDHVKPSRAILLCDQKLHTLEQPLRESLNVRVPFTVNNVYLTDPELISFQQGKINAITQGISGFSEGLVFCVEGNQIRLACLSLDAEPSMIPRRIPIAGTPKRVKYSPKLNKLIVLYYTKQVGHLGVLPGRFHGVDQRSMRYSITLVDPDAQTNLSDPEVIHLESSVMSHPFKNGEISLGVTEWFPQGNNGDHHVLVVNTYLQHLPPRPPTGRICLFSASANGVLTQKKTVEKEAPVHALMPYGSNSLVYSCGDDLCLQTLITNPNSSGWKFQDCVRFPLFSQARYITIREPFIYVSTIGKSILVLKVDEDQLMLQYNDEIARDNLFHLTIPQRSLILTSQTGCMITGLWQPSAQKGTITVSTVFEAQLPGSITRLRRIDHSAWKQSRNCAIADIIVGNTTDGSLFQFNILEENAWRLLAFIQTLALRTPEICPYVNTIGAHQCPLEPSARDPLDMHINGDILRRLLERGGERSLIEMMSSKHILEILLSHHHILKALSTRHSHHVNTPADSGTVDPSVRKATEIASHESAIRRNLMIKFAEGIGLVAANAEELVAKVEQWMRNLMQIIL